MRLMIESSEYRVEKIRQIKGRLLKYIASLTRRRNRLMLLRSVLLKSMRWRCFPKRMRSRNMNFYRWYHWPKLHRQVPSRLHQFFDILCSNRHLKTCFAAVSFLKCGLVLPWECVITACRIWKTVKYIREPISDWYFVVFTLEHALSWQST